MINRLKTTWKDITEFLKHPKEQKHENKRLIFKFKQLAFILSLKAILATGLAYLIFLVKELGWLNSDTHAVSELAKTTSTWYFLFLGVIAIPLVEEIIFRLYLRKKYNPIRLIGFFNGLLKPSSKKQIEETIDKNWHKYYRIFFYSAAILFGVIHISNYKLTKNVLLFMPLLIAPQTIGGLFLGYMRVKFGLLWSILLHAFYNFIFLGILILSMFSPVSDFEIENENYTLEVKASGFDSSQSVLNLHQKDTLTCENLKFKALLAYLLKSEENLIDIKPETTRLENISLKFISFNESLSIKDTITKQLQKQFDFEIIKTVQTRDTYFISVDDEERLNQYLSRTDVYSSSVITRDKIKLKNTTIANLAGVLSGQYDEIVQPATVTEKLFDIEMKRTDFEDVKQQLKDKYGLSFGKKSIEMEKIIIEFKE